MERSGAPLSSYLREDRVQRRALDGYITGGLPAGVKEAKSSVVSVDMFASEAKSAEAAGLRPRT